MSEPAILFVKPKAISQRDKKMLREAGVLIVEIDDPASAKFVRANSELSGSEMLLAAVKAIKASSIAPDIFGKAICAAIEAKAVP